MPQICFLSDETTIEAAAGCTILEACMDAGVPLFHACGGVARCSTCRVIIASGEEACEPRTEIEARLAARRGFGPRVRLGCQTRIQGNVRLRRIVCDAEDEALVSEEALQTGRSEESLGDERDLAILFADIRGFTTFTEEQLPYDVIHVLNRYFHRVSPIVARHHGRVVNLMGDGLMALFGFDRSRNAAQDAVRTALAMLETVVQMEHYIQTQFHAPFSIGIGIHYGRVILGEVGDLIYHQYTTIGDAVNTAARIEAATKQFGAPLLISEQVLARLGENARVGASHTSTLPGKSGFYTLFEVLDLDEGPAESPRENEA